MRERIQSFGGFMAGMIIPNIGAFIAWGLITALFIGPGWLPNARIADALVGPMILNMLPLLIAYTGGKMIHGTRGGVLGAVMVMGVIAGGGFMRDGEFNQIPMFLGAMIAGPFAGWCMKMIDDALEDNIPVGFEMLVNNFSAGILGTLLAILGLYFVGPVVTALTNAIGGIVDGMANAGVLPLAALVIEPAKVLFMNNAINHGVLGPLGVIASEETGRAVHFLLETNPGPGLGLLTAYWVAGKGLMKQSAPGAIIIHFLGGIHEIYFPYVLAKPLMILSVIAGGLLADFWFVLSNAGLSATPSPGSIFAYLAVTPRGQHLPVLTGVAIGAIAAALVGIVLLRFSPIEDTVEEYEDSMDDVSDVVPGLG